MPSWNDLGNVLSTVREIDVNAIREESEHPVFVACVGDSEQLETFSRVLHRSGSRRYGPTGSSPLFNYEHMASLPLDELRRADMLVLVCDGRRPWPSAMSSVLDELEDLLLPLLIVVLYGTDQRERSRELPVATITRVVTIADPELPQAADQLATALLDRLPGELHLSVARRVPGLRPFVARNLVNSTSFVNASYALASGLPAQIPILNIPFAAADIVVLTKNQALMVYKLALAHGAPPEFQSRIREVAPVLGGAYVWRQIARSLVGLMPVWGLVPKVTIAYAGTYTTGITAWRWYANGELVLGEQLKRISQEALAQGRARARNLLEQARQSGKESPGLLQRFKARLSQMLPGRRKKPKLTAPTDDLKQSE
ncbi:MAG: hypothetical protein MI924_11860 [Chloroflexales bacterium]|nr:hypothetical protein [Chloroflexales bacterium]